MRDYTPNIPDVVEEVRRKFESYETALIGKDVDILDDTFWQSPFTVRLALNEHGYGFDAIHAHRVARKPGPGTKEKRLRLEILTLGEDIATVNLVFKVRGKDLVGRQSQSWVKFPDVGWKVISAHVSTTDAVEAW
jgi:hypothetical protein